MKTLRLVLGDQLSDNISSLSDINENDCILMCELMNEATYVKHHPKKIAFIFSAMRHFAESLKEKKYDVRYIKLTDKENTGNFTEEVERALKETGCKKIVVTEPGEFRLRIIMEKWQNQFKVPIQIRNDDRFLCSILEFKKWAFGKKQLRMEYFYREMRKKYHILIENDGSPTGGTWNYDKENRKPPSKKLISPKRISHEKSAILIDVLSLVEKHFSHHFGDLYPFHYAVTREQALVELNDFIDHILPNFGDYQDAMLKGEAYLNHSLLSSYINAGLLSPLEVCQKAEKSYRSKKASICSVEGFIRQVIGWREYVRGIYWHFMPNYAEMNYFNAKEPLPHFFWGKNTNMACISEVVSQTKKHAYSHHIQRLMITGNFALLAGLDVKEVQKWYLEVYSDAFEWVEMPNTLGMALYGDGGILGSKPYAASANYINKMSDFCKNCFYNSSDMLSEKACPFNSLYWHFMMRNREKLEGNQRLPFVYKTLDNFSDEKRKAITTKASDIIKKMRNQKL